jgi:general control protein GCN4
MAEGNFRHFILQYRRRDSHPLDLPLYDFQDFDVDATGSFQQPYSPPTASSKYEFETSMTRSASNSTNVGTVSPQDLVVRDPMFSAPNSTALTNLTSPSMYNESPSFEDYEVSPMFGGGADVTSGHDWFTLFPDASNPVQDSPIDESPLLPTEELEIADSLRHNRRRSGTSPGSNKASSASGVAPRKRNQPLPPIIVDDPTDTVAIKRARNTLAARKSRQKKMERFDELENEIAKLKEERDHWKTLALARSAAQQ